MGPAGSRSGEALGLFGVVMLEFGVEFGGRVRGRVSIEVGTGSG